MPVRRSKLVLLPIAKSPGVGLFRLAQPGHSSFYNQLLPVFRTAAMLSDNLTPKAHRRVEEMRVGNNPGIESDFERVVGGHPLIIFGDFLFSLPGFIRGKTWQVVPGRLFP